MSDQFWLTKAQLKRIKPFFPRTVARNILKDFVSTAPQGREYVRKAKRLAAYLNALRPLRSHFLQRYQHRGNRYLWLGQ